ncbi:hypothetical protein QJQ45_026985, partial [Haematococcus lacustris]
MTTPSKLAQFTTTACGRDSQVKPSFADATMELLDSAVRCQGAVAPSISQKQQPQRQQVAAARAADKSKS